MSIQTARFGFVTTDTGKETASAVVVSGKIIGAEWLTNNADTGGTLEVLHDPLGNGDTGQMTAVSALGETDMNSNGRDTGMASGHAVSGNLICRRSPSAGVARDEVFLVYVDPLE